MKSVSAGKTVYTVYSKVTGGLIYRDEVTDNKRTDYAGLGPVGLRLVSGTGAGATFTHADHLGSPVAASDAGGAILWRERYKPFGAPLDDPAGNRNNTNYTGHLRDHATGLVYAQARYFDPLIGRFLSTDPIGYQDQFNLYGYVHNDPVNMFDPNGEDAEVAIRRNEFHASVQITNTENRLQTVVVRGGPNRNYFGASSGRSSGSGSGYSRLGTTGATTGSEGGDRASGSSSGDAGGSGRLQLVGEVADIATSTDGALVFDSGTVDVGSTTVTGDFSDVVGAAESFTNSVNDAGLGYKLLDQNSNSFAGTAYEQITGQPRPENNSGGVLPAYNVNLCERGAEC